MKAGDRTAAAKIKMCSKRRLCGKSMAISTYMGVTLKHRCGNRYLRWIRQTEHLWSLLGNTESEVRARAGCVGWDERMTVKRRGIKRGRGNTASSGCFQTNDRVQPSITQCYAQLTDKPLNITLVSASVTMIFADIRAVQTKHITAWICQSNSYLINRTRIPLLVVFSIWLTAVKPPCLIVGIFVFSPLEQQGAGRRQACGFSCGARTICAFSHTLTTATQPHFFQKATGGVSSLHHCYVLNWLHTA